MGGTVLALSQETRELLRNRTSFFSSISSAEGTGGLALQGKDTEARIERSVAATGEVTIDLIFPIDDNANPADGRIYVQDRFLFDASEQTFKKFERTFSYNGKGTGSWQDWLKKLQGASKPSADDAKEFGLTVARSHSRPLSAEDSKILQVFQAQKPYLAKAGDLARGQNSDWKLISGDAQNHYHLVHTGGRVELSTYLTLRRGTDAKSTLWLHEKFTLDASGKTLQRHERIWEAAPGADGSALQTTLHKLNQQSLPGKSEAQAFAAALLPSLTPTILAASVPAPAPAPPAPSPVPAAPAPAPPSPVPAPAPAPTKVSDLEFVFSGNGKTDREDTIETYSAKVQGAVRMKFVPQIKSEKIELLRFEMLVQINPATGSINRVTFHILENRGRITGESLKRDLEAIAGDTFRSFRFKSGINSSLKATFTMKPS